MTRREVVLAALALPLAGCARRAPGWPAGPVAGLDPGTWHPRAMVLDPSAGRRGRVPVFLRRDGGAVRALVGICWCRPAEGRCPVRWVEASERFICPCHGGVYNPRGRPVGGAERALEPRAAEVRDGRVYLTAGRSARRD